MTSRNQAILAVAGTLFLIVAVMEWLFPLNVVSAFGFVLPILLIATLRSRRLMLLTLTLCVVMTVIGLVLPGKKKERFTTVVFNRTLVVFVLTGVAYLGMMWEERKAREEAARAALATQTENLLRANTQMVDLKDKLARSERLAAVGQLVASVAHEVGTPLHSIAWHVEALAEEPAITEAMKKRIGIIDEQLNRVVRIIQDLLSSTRQRKPDPTWYPTDRLIEPVVALMEAGYVGKGVKLRAEVLRPAPLAWADQEKIHQVLVNLLSNALAATAPALLFVACLMVREFEEIQWGDVTESAPAVLTALMMPFTYSIANGLAFGFVSYAAIKLLTGRARDVHLATWVVAALFVIRFAFFVE